MRGLLLQVGNARKDLALEELEARAAPGGAVADLVGHLELLGSGGGVAAPHHRGLPLHRGLGDGRRHILRAAGEGLELEHAGGAVPDDGLGPRDHLVVEGSGLGARVEPHPARRDALLVGPDLGLRIGVELVAADEVDRQGDDDALRLGLLEQLLRDLGPLGIEEAVADLHALPAPS